jgi:L-ribulokinase
VSIVAGVDFGTLSVRVSIFDDRRGSLGSAIAEYPLLRKKSDPDHATQRHRDHMDALVLATRRALDAAGVDGRQIAAIALDTTGSSVVPVGDGLVPLDDYYLWCDHRAWEEAALITRVAHETGLEAIRWCGGTYSSEWGFSKLLHWLRHNPNTRDRLVTALEHCDMVAAVLCGITDPDQIPRSVCAAGHKWLWNPALGGFPPEEFFTRVDPLLAGIRAKMRGRFETSDHLAGRLSPAWAEQLGFEPGIPVPVGAFDAHWDAIGAGVRLGDVVNVVGTSTCIIAMSDRATLVPGVCGVVPGSVHPAYTGIEAGLSAVGDIFDAVARRAGVPLADLSCRLGRYRAGETGLLRLTWDNGDRTVLVNPELGGVTFGWNLTHTAEDELFAAIEGTAFHTRVVLERMEEHGVPIRRVINAGGIPRRNPTLNQVYANVLNKPVLVPQGEVPSVGSAIFAFRAAGAFTSIEQAQDVLCPGYATVNPDPESARTYEALYPLYRRLYFAFGRKDAAPIAAGDILPTLRDLAARVRRS